MIFWKREKASVVVLLLFPAIAMNLSCKRADQDASDFGRIIHPVPALIPGFEEAHELVSTSSDIGGSGDVQAISQALSLPTELFTLGVLEGERHEMFGQIVDVKEDSEGKIYVLDAQYNEVRVYDAEGTFLYAIGSRGEGAGEFVSPTSLEIDSSGRIIVSDRFHGLKIFSRNGETHELSATLSLSREVNEVCVTKEVLHLHSFDGLNVNAINRYSMSGDSLGSFGEVYSAMSPLVRRFLGRTQIACLDSKIIYAPNFLPVIYGYSHEGDRQWTAKISGFKAMEVDEDVGETGPRVGMNVHGKPHDQVIRAVPLRQDYVIVQIASFTPESLSTEEGERYETLRTYLMSAQTGKAVFIGDTVPVINTATENRVYTHRTHPYPQISVYDLSGLAK